ncbi:T9SS type B sorting domain-containing protein [Flavobacterium sp. RHBU_24]|uniref:T9SS type B sorting domain-containing protein n=1 Tax=Flavobacterium sp. RHBU_24 TaxID=3391185 RepID=UPI0039851BD5
MKKYFLLFCLCLQVLYVFGQGINCASMEPLCAGGSSFTFPSATNASVRAADAAGFGCLETQPNPSWFYIKIDQPGSLTINLSQVTNNGTPIDTDFICWGPFTDPPPICGPGNLNSGTAIDCSYSADASEQINILNTQSGEYYVLLITNFEGSAGRISLTQTNTSQGNAGSTDCTIACPLTLGDDIALCNGGVATLTANFAPSGNYNTSLTTIEWLRNGVVLPQTTKSITINETGSYSVNIYNPACGADVITDDVEVVAGTAVFTTAEPETLTILAPATGNYIFNLTENNAVILDGEDPAGYSIAYYESEIAAEEGSNPLPYAVAYNGYNGQTIWARVVNLLTSCPIVYSFTLNVISYATYITPNGDGYHDTWGISGLRGFKDVTITIFDRYGKLIKNMSPNSNSLQGRTWDGTFNGRMLPSDDYWFTLVYINKQGRKIELRSHIAMKR